MPLKPPVRRQARISGDRRQTDYSFFPSLRGKQALAERFGFGRNLVRASIGLQSVWHPRLINGISEETHRFGVDRPRVWQQRSGQMRDCLMSGPMQLDIAARQERGREV